MAAEEKTAGGPTSASETRDWERRSTDPTIPFDGALPENIPGPISNVELELAAEKRAYAHGRGVDEGSARLRPEHAKQAAKSGDAVTDSDVLANPAAGLEVGEDRGEDERNRTAGDKAADEGKSTPPQGRTSSPRGQQKA
jgi:hypothetical protein